MFKILSNYCSKMRIFIYLCFTTLNKVKLFRLKWGITNFEKNIPTTIQEACCPPTKTRLFQYPKAFFFIYTKHHSWLSNNKEFMAILWNKKNKKNSPPFSHNSNNFSMAIIKQWIEILLITIIKNKAPIKEWNL